MVSRKTAIRIRKTHRYLGLFLGIQFLMWTISGLYFSWTDIDDASPQNLSVSNSSYFQYGMAFETDNSNYTPELYNVTIFYAEFSNSAPTAPALLYLPDGNATINRSPTMTWNNSYDADNDTLTYQFILDDNPAFNLPEVNITGINESNTTNTSYQVPLELDVDKTYYWKVRAHDNTTYGNFSTVFNFTVDSYAAISLIVDGIAFGEAFQGDSFNSSDGVHDPFQMENLGNIPINITITASKWFDSVQYPSEYYQFRIEENETDAFNTTLSQTTWINMSNVSSSPAVVDLDWHYFKNDFLASVLVTVPNTEPIGVKKTTVTFEAG